MDRNKGVDKSKGFHEKPRGFAAGGADKHMFQQQAAATRRPDNKSGKDDVRGPGKKFAGGSAGTPSNKSKIGISAPAAPFRTGNIHGSTLRDYRKTCAVM